MQNQDWRLQTLQQRLRGARLDTALLANRHVELGRRLKEAMQRTLERYDMRLSAAHQHLQHLDPQQVLARGYSMVRNEKGAVVVDSATVAPGERLNVTFARGWAEVELKEKGN
jgi:exodeoxyribonuclease VII large subunit